MFEWIYLFVLFLPFSATSLENKTSSECWACATNKPHVLDCTGSGVIVIHDARYGYAQNCASGITGSGCNSTERERCCKPLETVPSCFKEFNDTDMISLQSNCADKTTCNFNSIKHEENVSCFSRHVNSFTRIYYTCLQTEIIAPITVSTTRLITSTNKPTAPIPSSTTVTGNNPQNAAGNNGLTSGETAGIVVGVIAICILLIVLGFLIQQKYGLCNTTYKSQLNQCNNTTSRTVGVQYSETDFNNLHVSPNMGVSTDGVNLEYAHLHRLGSDHAKYEELNLQKNEDSDYYNKQYVNT